MRPCTKSTNPVYCRFALECFLKEIVEAPKEPTLSTLFMIKQNSAHRLTVYFVMTFGTKPKPVSPNGLKK
jgi:hypothetical protein